MSVTSSAELQQLLDLATGGSRDALGRLLVISRPYLLEAARKRVPASLQAKFGASDVVQETLLRAYRHFPKFRGHNPAQLGAWLQRILVHCIASHCEHFASQKCQVGREVSLNALIETQTDFVLPESLVPGESPSAQATQREEAELMELALQRLPAVYRDVIRLRYQENCSFVDIGQRMTRTAEGARKLCWRALERLGLELGIKE